MLSTSGRAGYRLALSAARARSLPLPRYGRASALKAKRIWREGTAAVEPPPVAWRRHWLGSGQRSRHKRLWEVDRADEREGGRDTPNGDQPACEGRADVIKSQELRVDP